MNPIEILGVSHRYGRTEALRDLSLTVPAGQVCALLGANGAGKTTLLKVVMNLLHPTAGEARVLGVSAGRLGPRELAQIGYVSENQDMPRWMTVRRFLDYCRGFNPSWDQALEAKLLAQFDLPEDRALRQLSRGMRMKAALLSALAYRPRLLVLDEPFSGLDPVVRADLMDGLLEAATAGDWTVLLSSHDIEEVERLANHVAVLEAGRLRFAEATEALLARFRRVEVEWSGPMDTLASPPGWLAFEREGTRARFVESRYERDATERACRARFPAATVRAHPMTLREIFLAQARAERAKSKDAHP